MPRKRTLRTAAALAAGGMLLSGCSGSGSTGEQPAGKSTTAAASPAPADLEPYYGQKLRWRSCGPAGFECATMRVPLDYTKPAGDPADGLGIAVTRKRAKGAKPLGSLLVNPGGPGGSAVDYIQSTAQTGYPASVRDRYDLVGFDPRGVARSEPVQCLSDTEMDRFTRFDTTPDDKREVAALVGASKRFANGCKARSGRVLPHVSTVEAARDMDILRALLGDQKLHYIGLSYGTFLGATYAELFPRRAGRLVLDGAMDPTVTAKEAGRAQAGGFETAFRAYAGHCVRTPDCPLGNGSVDDAGETLDRFFKKLDSDPMPTDDGNRELTEPLAITGVIAAMYDESYWTVLNDALDSASDGDGSGLLELSDVYYEREPTGQYSNLMYANSAVNCVDLAPAARNPEDVEKLLPSYRKTSPRFGTVMAWSTLTCAYWTVKATGHPHRIKAEGADPILVVGTTRDPATPYRWAESLAAQLDSGVLLTYDGDGHTAYGRGSACVDDAVNEYLLEGKAPKDGKRCS